MARSSSSDPQSKDNLTLALTFFKECGQEFWKGVNQNRLPWPLCCGVGAGFAILFSLRLDAFAWRLCHVGRLYPFYPFFYWSYAAVYITSGFWLWTLSRVVARRKLVAKLSSVFQNGGLKTHTGRLPGFVSDVQMDSYMRRLSLSSVGIPESEFKKAKPYLEAELQVFIDQIKSDLSRGTVELLYAHEPIPEYAAFEPEKKLGSLCFMVGMTRSKPLIVSLREVPHILIGGYTNSGKSTFLRQMLITLVRESQGAEFTLIDLKRGLELGPFEGLPSVKVYADAAAAIAALQYVEGQLEQRMALLRANNAHDLDAFFKVPPEKRKFTSEWPKERNVARHVVVIDEAAELFLASTTLAAKDAQVAKRLASKIAALGRAVGIHLVIATQRPDRNAVDPLIKTNLQGRLCFQMADNASSMTILDSVRAADLPPIKGRAIWRSGMDLLEVQVPELTRENLNPLLDALKPKQEAAKTTEGEPEARAEAKESKEVEDGIT